MKNKNIPLLIGIFIMLIGSLLPSIRIASENISFIKDNGILLIILILSMLILLKLEKKEYIYIPSTISLVVILRFIVKNINRLKQINELYNCYAAYQYGLIILIIGNILVLLALTLSLINIKEILEKQKEKKVSHETTKDGKIKFNKIIIKVDNEKTKTKKEKKVKTNKKQIKILQILKTKLTSLKSKNKIKKLSITKFKDDNKVTLSKKTVVKVPVIDIQKWTRNEICCLNCGATVNTTSEYCFLCDCKIKLKDKEKQIS